MGELECTSQLSEVHYHSFDCSEVGTQYYIGDLDDLQSTPQISETQSQSVDSTEIVTQEYLVPEQLGNCLNRQPMKMMSSSTGLESFSVRTSMCLWFFLAFKWIRFYVSSHNLPSYIVIGLFFAYNVHHNIPQNFISYLFCCAVVVFTGAKYWLNVRMIFRQS